MSEKGKHIKKILYWTILLAMFLPLIQEKTFLFKIRSLTGFEASTINPFISKESWLSEAYQKQQEKYLKENFGFRSWFIRLNNQIDWWLFGEFHYTDLVIGKNDQLFLNYYIDGYAGKDFLGEDVLREKCFKLRKVQDTLKKKNIDLLVLLAPGKANYFPEYIPKQYDDLLNKHLRSNYDFLSKELLRSGVHTLDMNKCFNTLKNKTAFPLYPQGGVHWTEYGAAIAADSLIANMERVSGKNYLNMKVTGGEIRDTMPVPDRELTDGMNLFFPPPAYKTAYPIIQFDSVDKIKPNVLSIADSYFNNLVAVGLCHYGFSNQSLNWEWNWMAHSVFTNEFTYVNKLDFKTEVEKRDFILIVSTTPNLKTFGWGFIESAYNLYYPATEEEISKWIEMIKTDTSWIEKIKEKAKTKNISFEESLREDAIFMYKEKGPRH